MEGSSDAPADLSLPVCSLVRSRSLVPVFNLLSPDFSLEAPSPAPVVDLHSPDFRVSMEAPSPALVVVLDSPDFNMEASSPALDLNSQFR